MYDVMIRLFGGDEVGGGTGGWFGLAWLEDGSA